MKNNMKEVNKKLNKIHWGYLTTVVAVFAVAMSFLGLYSFGTDYEINRVSSLATSVSVTETAKTNGVVAGAEVDKANISISRGNGYNISYDLEVTQGLTVLDALQKAAQTIGLNLQTKNYGAMGTLVEGVGDLIGGQDNNYWSFYLNGQPGTVAADQQVIAPGDKIMWRFEKSLY